MDININSNTNYKCINYKFCKGVAYPELDEPLKAIAIPLAALPLVLYNCIISKLDSEPELS